MEASYHIDANFHCFCKMAAGMPKTQYRLSPKRHTQKLSGMQKSELLLVFEDSGETKMLYVPTHTSEYTKSETTHRPTVTLAPV
jgi:hypothetical protein